MSALVFLHTAAVHVQSFDALLRELAPNTRARHLVREDLLASARRAGSDDPGVADAVRDAVHEASEGAELVLCTCSTIGALAERSADALGVAALRIDRPMAEQALRLGPRIVVAAALESTIGPTSHLLEEVARDTGAQLELEALLIADAWTLFEHGDLEGYYDTIAHTLAGIAHADAVVLAQASMAGALERLGGHGTPVLSSPLLGLRAALEMMEAR